MTSDTTSETAEAISIDAVLEKLHHWRENKSSYPDSGIPDTVWKMIFALEDAGHRPSTLRSLFSLNSGQYAKKHEQLSSKPRVIPLNQISPTPSKDKQATDPIAFSQISVASPAPPISEVPSLTQAAAKNRQTVKKLRSTDSSSEHYLDTTTIIVECIRADGHRLKIHTTTNRLDTIMQAFFSQESITC